MIRRFVCTSLLTLAVAACASGPQLDPDQAPRSRYSGQAGESPVGVIPEGQLRDQPRSKDLLFTVEYPTRPGLYPLVIFSHGFGETRQAYVGLSSHWASQGYVVIKPAHSDSGRLRSGGAADAWRDQTETDWRNRARDITFLIDSLDEIEKAYPELQGKIDRAKIGMGGHSYGALTAMLVGGARTEPGAKSYVDARVKAIVAMSPPGPSTSRGLTNTSWSELRTPTLFMVGSIGNGVDETETPEWRRQAFELSPAGDKWLAVLEGGSPASFTGRMDPRVPGGPDQGRSPMLGDNRTMTTPDVRRPTGESGQGLRIRAVFNDIKAVSLAFFDAYLRSDAEGRTTLENAGSRGGVQLLKK
jgi:predicted dienelactone hydrolase